MDGKGSAEVRVLSCVLGRIDDLYEDEISISERVREPSRDCHSRDSKRQLEGLSRMDCTRVLQGRPEQCNCHSHQGPPERTLDSVKRPSKRNSSQHHSADICEGHHESVSG